MRFRLQLKKDVRKLAYGVCFGLRWRDTFIEKTLSKGYGVVIVVESETPGRFIRNRFIQEVYFPKPLMSYWNSFNEEFVNV